MLLSVLFFCYITCFLFSLFFSSFRKEKLKLKTKMTLPLNALVLRTIWCGFLSFFFCYISILYFRYIFASSKKEKPLRSKNYFAFECIFLPLYLLTSLRSEHNLTSNSWENSMVTRLILPWLHGYKVECIPGFPNWPLNMSTKGHRFSGTRDRIQFTTKSSNHFKAELTWLTQVSNERPQFFHYFHTMNSIGYQ